MVPTGTLSTMSSPSRPLLLLPSPWRPRSALYSGLKRKCTSVLWRSLDSMYTSPPRPPSPPEGPPRGTNFSRRKATHPLPPSPALTRIRASSMNICNFVELAQTLEFVAKAIGHGDRKSTRLNSSHSQISYAVFCLKKKNMRRPALAHQVSHIARHPPRAPIHNLPPPRIHDLLVRVGPCSYAFHAQQSIPVCDSAT